MNTDTLRQLIISCRRKHMRFLGWPRDWAPHCIRNPDGFYFTESTAWEFVAEKLEAGHQYEEMVLDNPKGAMAIVMHIQLTATDPLLYVKIQVGAGNKAIGRSFHYSDHYK